jgi:hypothetical protein
MKLWLRQDQPGADWHPDDDTLLLAIEAELTPAKTLEVEQHVNACWTCKARSEEFRRGILAFVEYREKRCLPVLPEPPNEFQNFGNRLSALEMQCAARTLLHRATRAIEKCFHSRWRAAWMGAAVGVFLAAMVWMWPLANPPLVSATELLIRAEDSQSIRPKSAARSARLVAHQRVRIQSRSSQGRSSTVERDFEWPVGIATQSTRWEVTAEPLSWNAPLTAAAFANWRNSLPSKQDEVRRSGGLITLETASYAGPVRNARLVVRAADYHPVEEDLRLADSQEVQISEIAFEIREILPAATVRNVPSPAAELAPDAPAPIPNEAELSNIELDVRYQLFQHRWDVGEDLQLSRSVGQVRLAGEASSQALAIEIRAALEGIPNLFLAIQSPEEAVSTLPSTPALPAISAEPAPARSKPFVLPLLEKAFPSAEDRRDFINRSLESSDAALSHAWALKRLADRYTESELSLLTAQSQGELLEIVHSHLAELQANNIAVRTLIALMPDVDSAEQQAAHSWRDVLLSLFEQTQQQDRLITQVLTSSNPDVSGTVVHDLATAHARVEAESGEAARKMVSRDAAFFNF